MAKLHFVVSKKGGVGKSVFFYMLACLSKYTDNQSKFICADHTSRSAMKRCIFADVKEEDLLDPLTKVLDRQKIDDLVVRSARDKEVENIFVDFGGEGSKQLLEYLKNKGNHKLIHKLRERFDFELYFHCILAGDDMFPETMEYCENLLDLTKEVGLTTVWLNKYKSFMKEQVNFVIDKTRDFDVNIKKFNVIDEPYGDTTADIINQMDQGLYALDHADFAAEVKFEQSLEDMNFKF